MITPMVTTSSHPRPAEARPATGEGKTPRPHRWAPAFSLTDGGLVGAECILAPETSADARAHGAAAFPSCRQALADAMRLADDFLRAGCPLPLSVRLCGGSLDEPELMRKLEAWSMDHGGAHRLLGIEIDVGAWDLGSLATCRRLATLGYEVTLGGATTIDPAIAQFGAKRFSIAGSLVRGADVDDARAARLHVLAEEVREHGLLPVFKGVVDPDRSVWLRSRTSHGHWQFDTNVVSLGERGLRVLAESLPAWRDGTTSIETAKCEEDLTWVNVVTDPATDRSRRADDREAPAEDLAFEDRSPRSAGPGLFSNGD